MSPASEEGAGSGSARSPGAPRVREITPAGPGAVSVLSVGGPGALELLGEVWPRVRRVQIGGLRTLRLPTAGEAPGARPDEVLVLAASAEHVERTSVARKLLTEGVQRWRLDHALRLHEQGHITRERAAEIAGVSIYDVLDALRQRGTLAQYSLEELREDLTLLQGRYSNT